MDNFPYLFLNVINNLLYKRFTYIHLWELNRNRNSLDEQQKVLKIIYLLIATYTVYINPDPVEGRLQKWVEWSGNKAE